MSRAELLRDIEAIISGAGFELSNSEAPMTFKKNVSYPGLIAGKNEIAHFLLFTNTGTVQITAKWQEVSGTAIEKLGHTVLDAQHTQHQSYFVVCGGGKLVTRAVDYLNAHRILAPRLRAMQVKELESALEEII